MKNTDFGKVDNVFFHKSYQSTRVLVLAPHPDDEINVAGNMILTLREAGAEVYVAYSTNGDFDWPAEIRFREVEESLRILHVDSDHFFLLGYGDTYNHTGKPHVFYAEQTVASPAGYTETYGVPDHPDYIYYKENQHHTYTRQHYLEDLERLISDIRADIIFCVDYDMHADHRMLSLSFETVMGHILKNKDMDYHPTVYKKFAYAMGFTAAQDYSVINNRETIRPVVGEIEAYPYDLIDQSCFGWPERVRFPVNYLCITSDLKKNPLAQAVFAHKSQRNEKNILGLLNSDDVYWQRRTDSLGYSARVMATSGDASHVNNFQLLSTLDIDDTIPTFDTNLWKPEKNDPDKMLHFSWDQPQEIAQIRLYGNFSEEGSIEQIEISCDNGFSQKVGPLLKKGTPLVIPVIGGKEIRSCSVKILKMTGNGAGISECEFFKEPVAENRIAPFIKIMVQDNFVYQYYYSKKTQNIDLNIY